MKNIIITGASGFIGTSLINKLILKKTNIIALDISFANSKIPDLDSIMKIETNLIDVSKIKEVIPKNDYDAFYHFAWAGVNGSQKTDHNVQLENIRITMNCATVAKDIGCKKFLCAGTVAENSVKSLNNIEYANKNMMYGVAKYATHIMLDAYCKSIGLNLIWMQLSNIYGPNNKTGNLVSYTLDQLFKNEIASFGPALQAYDFIYIDDLLEAIIRLGNCENTRHNYFVGSGNPRVLKDYLIEIGEKCKKRELIKIGVREDDGIKYTFDMFDIKDLIKDIGEYTLEDFSKRINYTIEHYGKSNL